MKSIKNFLILAVVLAGFLAAVMPHNSHLAPSKPSMGSREDRPSLLKWFPPLQCRLRTRITKRGEPPITTETKMTIGTTRLLIEPAPNGKPGFLIPADPFRERPAVLLHQPPVILRWVGETLPTGFPLRRLLGNGLRRESPMMEKMRKQVQGQKGEAEQVGGRKARKITLNTWAHRITLWRDIETGIPLKIVREPNRGGVREETEILDLQRATAEDADKYIADFLSRREEWEAGDWRSEGRVQRILDSEGLPINIGNLPARRVKIYRRGERQALRVFYGGRQLQHFFAVELTTDNVPSFMPDSPHPPVFTGTINRWKVRIWTNLPKDMANRQIRNFRDRLAEFRRPRTPPAPSSRDVP